MSTGSCFANAVDLVSHKNAFECALTLKKMRDKVELHATIFVKYIPFLCEIANISSEQPHSFRILCIGFVGMVVVSLSTYFTGG